MIKAFTLAISLFPSTAYEPGNVDNYIKFEDAIRSNDKDTAQKLLDNGVNINFRSPKGQTLLSYCYGQWRERVGLMFEGGGCALSKDCVDKISQGILEHERSMKLLLSLGANPLECVDSLGNDWEKTLALARTAYFKSHTYRWVKKVSKDSPDYVPGKRKEEIDELKKQKREWLCFLKKHK